MRSTRKIAIAAISVLGVLLLLMVALPYMFRDRISARLQAEVSNSVNARVAWGGVGLGLFRNFPNLTVRLDDLSVAGIDRFEGDTLLTMESFNLVLDLGSVLRSMRDDGPIVVRRVALREPVVRALVLEDGAANWNIVREDPAAGPADTTGAMSLSLQRLTVDNGLVTFTDRQAGLAAVLAGLNHSLSGDLASDQVTIETSTRIDTLSVRFAGVPYLNQVRVELDADIDANMGEGRFTFGDDHIRINDLMLAFGGTVQTGEENTTLDISFAAPTTDFAHILSLIPAIYQRDFRQIQTSGTMSVEGSIRGDYGPSTFPSLAIDARVDNGTFRYPDLPLPARDISLALGITNPGGDVDSTVVNLERFHMLLGDRPVDATFAMRTPVSDPDVALSVTGSVDLADVGRTVKLEGVQELSGVVDADFAMRTRMSWVDQALYDRIAASGSLGVRDIAMLMEDLPHPITVDSALLRFTPQHAELARFTGRVGNSDLSATGSLDNLLGFVLRDEEIRGRANVISRHFDLNEWKSEEENEVIPVPRNVDFAMQVVADSISYGTLGLTNARGAVHVKDERVTIEGFRMNILGGTASASGFYETTNPALPVFDMNVTVDSLDIPSAFASFVTVQALAPVARYATGVFSAQMDMSGALGQDMSPVLQALTGDGTFSTGRLIIQDFPALARVADALSLDAIRNPTMQALRSSFAISEGRLHVRPFEVEIGEMSMSVVGSNGLDQSLDYNLGIAVPTRLLGSAASDAIGRLASAAGRVGLDLGAAEVVSIGVGVTGTVTSPSVAPSFSGTAGTLREGVQQAAEQAVESRVAEVREQVDEAAQEARERAREQGARLVAEAEERAARIRLEADSLAAAVRREGNEAADVLLERASNPAARIAAQAGADRLRREADDRADQIVREADARATELVESAQRQADALVPPDP